MDGMAIELTASDIEMIANAIGCTKRQVRHVLKGERGERNTALQQKIRTLAGLRQQQNATLQFYASVTLAENKKIDPSPLPASIDNYQELRALLSPYIIDNNNDGIFAFNHKLQYTLWNAKMEEISGFQAKQCIGKTPIELFSAAGKPLDYERDTDIKKRVLAGEHVFLPATAYIYPSGKEFWHELQIRPLYDQQKNIIGGVGILKDVTSYMQIQQELRENIARYQIIDVFMTTTVCKGFMCGTHYIMEWVSPSFKDNLGYTLEQFNMASRQSGGWIFNEAQALRYKATEQQLLSNRPVKDFVMFTHRSGRLIPTACYYKPLQPTKQGYAAFLLAITEVQTYKDNNWQIRAFFDDAENFFAIIQSKTFEILYANPALMRYARNGGEKGTNFVDIHRRYHHRELKQALFRLNEVFDRAYVILDMGANRAFDSRRLIWLFVQVNPTTIYAVGKVLV
ncbi:PAS domain-containing protein [Rhodoflexus sp.]